MNEDRFFELLRDDARQLQFTPDDVVATRIAARVRARVASQPSLSQLLAGWLRPMMASVAAFALTAVVGLVWIERTDNSNSVTVEAMASTSSAYDIALDGDSFLVGE